MTAMLFGMPPQMTLILLIVLAFLIFGSRLAGLGKSAGTAIREFKEETDSLRKKEETPAIAPSEQPVATSTPTEPSIAELQAEMAELKKQLADASTSQNTQPPATF